MNKADSYAKTLHVSRHVVRHSYNTALAYAEQVAHFVEFCQVHRPAGSNEQRVAAYLSHVAPRISASTQRVKLNALVFFFAQVLEKPLGDLGPWSHARVAKRMPVWLNPSEMRSTLDLMPGTFGLMARLTYGSGLRLMECVRLRIQHVDLEKRTLFIIGAKGDKDRVVPIAKSLVAPLGEHIQRVRGLWEGDQANGYAPVMLPDGLERKYPNYGRQWEWFWMWPGRNLSRDPESGTIRRHHTHEDVYSRSLKVAARRAGIGKRVTMHVLRHSFATHFLENGGDIHVLQKLLGHSHIETTSIYLHCLPKLVTQARSPLDDLTPQVVPFPTSSSHCEAKRLARISG